MVQRKVPSKLCIQPNHVKSDKNLVNMKLSSSLHQDCKTRGPDMNKKLKSKSLKLSDLEALQTSYSPSKKSLHQSEKLSSLHVAKTSASPQKQQHMMKAQNGSPNYMKPTSSSHAKKELFLVSFRNTQSGCSDPRKFSSDSKASCVVSSNKKASLSLVRTLTKKTTSFKVSRSCPRKSTRVSSMCATDKSTPQRATCSSTLKDSKFPSELMLNSEGTELEGTSVVKVCPYTYCSLNGHHHAPLPPLKSFVSQRRRLLKKQMSKKLMGALSPRISKVPCEIENEGCDVEQNVCDGKPAYDEIGMDFFIEIDAKGGEETGAEEIGELDFHKGIEDQEDMKSTNENDSKQVNSTVPDTATKFEIDLKKNLKKAFDDVAIEVDDKVSLFQEQNGGDSDLIDQSCWFHEEISMGSYCSDDSSFDGVNMEDAEMNGSDSKAIDMVWEDENCRKFEDEEGVNSDVFTEEDNDSKVESLSESSNNVSVIWLDNILSSHYEDVTDEELEEADAEESKYFEDQPHEISSCLEGTTGSNETQETDYSSGRISYDQSSSTEKMFECLTNAEDNDGVNEEQVEDEIICKVKVLNEEKTGYDQCPKMSETGKTDERGEDIYSILENIDESIEEANQVHLFDVQDKSTSPVDDQELSAKDQGKVKDFQILCTSCIVGEEKDSTKNLIGGNRRKRPVEDVDEMRNFNPREPNFLPLVPEPDPEKVDLKHQMIDERKNADDWMIDCALRQVVTKLAPARKKKVALLVEAFETVMPIPKYDTRMRNNSAYAHPGRIQACS
ncbi:hypothetical protein Lal_00024376 [Lupinus albus]|uniref:Putative calcium/calmodulin-dependent protein kinase n=1 Tax=Lupinus albus TaxID=3870 RepID=A0A6A4N3S5_LUPAL|nr:putative calcium/calmodulin-dependent protein kinase [Lupinus albus]KAF1866366.1 hypothetical protein Lal_00024376 [Lupinus albus]